MHCKFKILDIYCIFRTTAASLTLRESPKLRVCLARAFLQFLQSNAHFRRSMPRESWLLRCAHAAKRSASVSSRPRGEWTLRLGSFGALKKAKRI